MVQDWLSEIAAEMSIDCLPESYQTVAQIVGMENALKLSQHLGGTCFYYPQIDTLLRAKRDERIRKEFNGANHRELARKYNLTESWIRSIVQRQQAYEQSDMFGGSEAAK